jgi:hypothetical protein
MILTLGCPYEVIRSHHGILGTESSDQHYRRDESHGSHRRDILSGQTCLAWSYGDHVVEEDDNLMQYLKYENAAETSLIHCRLPDLSAARQVSQTH